MSRVLKNSVNQVVRKYNLINHKGIDVISYKNKTADVIAHSDGVIVELVAGKTNNLKATGKEAYGNYVKIKHDNGMYTLYAHLKSVYVKKNSRVKRGDVLGPIGKSGRAAESHLHFEVINKYNMRVNPTLYLDKELPSSIEYSNIVYQVYDTTKKKWLPKVVNEGDYAGNFGNPISAIYIHLTRGFIEYRVHEFNKGWLTLVDNQDDYAGNIGEKIDGFQLKSNRYQIFYRVHLIDFGWLPWTKRDEYAGIFGYAIDAIQIKIQNC